MGIFFIILGFYFVYLIGLMLWMDSDHRYYREKERFIRYITRHFEVDPEEMAHKVGGANELKKANERLEKCLNY